MLGVWKGGRRSLLFNGRSKETTDNPCRIVSSGSEDPCGLCDGLCLLWRHLTPPHYGGRQTRALRLSDGTQNAKAVLTYSLMQ